MNDIRSYNELGGIPPDVIDMIESSNPLRDQAVEDMADNLLDDCKQFAKAEAINAEHSLYDGELLPSLMVEIANWSGRSRDDRHDNANAQMVKLHNLLANALHEIAEREVAR